MTYFHYTKSPKRSHLEEVFVRSWWVVLFVLICYAVYEQGMIRTKAKAEALRANQMILQEEKLAAMSQQKDLMLQINSQSDPAWIELTLMKGLGLVPEGQTKVYFKGVDN